MGGKGAGKRYNGMKNSCGDKQILLTTPRNKRTTACDANTTHFSKIRITRVGKHKSIANNQGDNTHRMVRNKKETNKRKV